MRHISKLPKCKRCKRNPVARPGRVCDSCRKSPASSGARIAKPDLARILSFPVGSESYYTDQQARHITTADLLALREKSLLSCNGPEFEIAAELADGWNAFLNNQPITIFQNHA